MPAMIVAILAVTAAEIVCMPILNTLALVLAPPERQGRYGASLRICVRAGLPGRSSTGRGTVRIRRWVTGQPSTATACTSSRRRMAAKARSFFAAYEWSTSTPCVSASHTHTRCGS